jgi:subtilase family serine protease
MRLRYNRENTFRLCLAHVPRSGDIGLTISTHIGSHKAAFLAATLFTGCASASFAAPLVTGRVDDSVTAAVAGDRSAYLPYVADHGELAPSEILAHVQLVLKRPPELQAKLDKLVEDQLNKKSPDYHKWLNPADLRAYGPDQADIEKVIGWLQSHGLKVNSVSPSGMSIDFGGSHAAIAAAFHAALHHVTLPSGEAHITPMTDPAIPAALAPVVRGAMLSNFFPKPNYRKFVQPADNIAFNPVFYAVAPADFRTIYNINPANNGLNLYGFPITGKGVTIALVEQTDILPNDWTTFRKAFGLGKYSGTLSLVHPNGCTDPGFIPDETEAAIDVEWASVPAPDATILEASCAATSPLYFGVATTLQNLVEFPTPATVFSISYGGAEAGNGLTFLAGWVNLVEEGASEGKSIMISSGDSGVGADEGINVSGLAVNGLSTNPFNTTLGGTDFADTSLGKLATYWSPTNGKNFSSALSYIPEIPWDNSCASSVIWKYLDYTNSITACNALISKTGVTANRKLPPFIQEGIGGTGGQSQIYVKPSWQSAPGVPNDGVRDQPDLSLFASNGSWDHAYVICMSDPNEGGVPCDFKKPKDANLYGGTSFAAPDFAGIMALIVQAYGGNPLGNPAPTLYQIATAQFSRPELLAKCKSVLGTKESAACVFNNVTVSNNAEPCLGGTPNCYTTSASTRDWGVLSSDFTHEVDAFPSRATGGYSLATGLGSVNVLNLIYSFEE